jgi:hypothetical protein
VGVWAGDDSPSKRDRQPSLCVYALRARPQRSLAKEATKKRSFLHPVTSLGLLHLQETAFKAQERIQPSVCTEQ